MNPPPTDGPPADATERAVRIDAGSAAIDGDLTLPATAAGVVAFAHGSGSGRHSPRNRQVAGVLVGAGVATLLIDLLTPEEEARDRATAELRFDVALLTARLVAATEWLRADAATQRLPVGYFGASTGAAAALRAAAERPDRVAAIVSRGGRPDLAGDALDRVRSPTLLLVGSRDEAVLGLNRRAHERLRCRRDLRIVPGAGHLFEEPGALAVVAALARDWFVRWFGAAGGV